MLALSAVGRRRSHDARAVVPLRFGGRLCAARLAALKALAKIGKVGRGLGHDRARWPDRKLVVGRRRRDGRRVQVMLRRRGSEMSLFAARPASFPVDRRGEAPAAHLLAETRRARIGARQGVPWARLPWCDPQAIRWRRETPWHASTPGEALDVEAVPQLRMTLEVFQLVVDARKLLVHEGHLIVEIAPPPAQVLVSVWRSKGSCHAHFGLRRHCSQAQKISVMRSPVFYTLFKNGQCLGDARAVESGAD